MNQVMCENRFAQKFDLYGIFTEFSNIASQIALRGCLHGGRKILVTGRSQRADHPSAICILYSVYMQRVVIVPSARIFRAERQEDPSTRKVLGPCKLLSLGRSQYQGQATKMSAGRSVANYGNKGRPFRLYKIALATLPYVSVSRWRRSFKMP